MSGKSRGRWVAILGCCGFEERNGTHSRSPIPSGHRQGMAQYRALSPIIMHPIARFAVTIVVPDVQDVPGSVGKEAFKVVLTPRSSKQATAGPKSGAHTGKSRLSQVGHCSLCALPLLRPVLASRLKAWGACAADGDGRGARCWRLHWGAVLPHRGSRDR